MARLFLQSEDTKEGCPPWKPNPQFQAQQKASKKVMRTNDLKPQLANHMHSPLERPWVVLHVMMVEEGGLQFEEGAPFSLR